MDIVPSFHLAVAASAVAALPLADEALAAGLLAALAALAALAGIAGAGAAAALAGAAVLAAALAAPFCTPPWWLQAPFPPLELEPSLQVTVVAVDAPSAHMLR